ncbi:probable ATP-dependent RNA helicase DDX28 [Adelges cooleyi]|uniref:probable ATP-dependent RNA helicase DDX28 n=1 Tax=Adelges cooleyi TaxID=133065 RepID=UPI0021808656|nr:probable ATP-dependent RNA helicase DDX28 [Adelges cooleyi]
MALQFRTTRFGLLRVCLGLHRYQQLVQSHAPLKSTKNNVSFNILYQNVRHFDTNNEKIIELNYSDVEPIQIPVEDELLDFSNEIKLANTEAVIKCKRKKLNHERNQKYEKFTEVPLASKGWKDKKSKDDFFTIHIYNNDYSPQSRKSQYDFVETGLVPPIINILQQHKITVPSQIQALGIPEVLKGKNTLLAAETGCGKTFAYLAPVIQSILMYKEKKCIKNQFNSPLALIIVPSRELAGQIGEFASWFSEELPLKIKVITGGHTKRQIVNPTFEENDIVVATLGALSKLTTTGIYSMRCVRHIVLDEADTLLDDSFNELLTHFLGRFHFKGKGADRHSDLTQLILVSATMPTSLANILSGIMDVDNLSKVKSDRLHAILPHVQQKFIRTNRGEKPSNLLLLAKKLNKSKTPTIVFCSTSSTCDWATMFLNENGINAINLHGDMMYNIRMGKFKQYQDGNVNFLVCTDIGSRGLNTIRTKHIINYDFPLYAADYIHRCGRTGRLNTGLDGKVTNFISAENEIDLVQKIELSARIMKSIPNVNANITKIRRFHILNKLEDAAKCIK